MNASVSNNLPRILLLEDDPVSAAFLSAAIEALPAQVDAAATLAEARKLSGAARHELWLFDANLPDGTGAGLLAELRAHGLHTPALAHTADLQRESLDALIEAGFEEVLLKPLSIAQLQGAIRRMLDVETGSTGHHISDGSHALCGKLPIWDDDAALRAFNGHRAHADLMRGLFRQELPQVFARISSAITHNDNIALRGELHKLQASCGFVGAARLGAATRALHETSDSSDAIEQFKGALQDTLSSPS
jgi:DNA-binding response OmpR family regulator